MKLLKKIIQKLKFALKNKNNGGIIMRKKILLGIVFCIILVVACAKKETYVQEKITFTDSLGRKVRLDKNLQYVAPSGPLAQLVLYTIASDKLSGWAKNPSSSLAPFLDERVKNLPSFGQFYGKNSSFNLEEVIKSKTQVIIDIGFKKKDMVNDLDTLSRQTNIPVVFIEAKLSEFDKTYEMLGSLLHVEKKAALLADFARKTYTLGFENSKKIKSPLKIYLAGGVDGLHTNNANSIHNQVIDLIGFKNIDSEKTKGFATSPISKEELLKFNPDIIIANGNNIVELSKVDPFWSSLNASKNGMVFDIPQTPFNWIASPPSVNILPGILWLGQVAYPDIYVYDLHEKIKAFYKLFYNFDMSDEYFKTLVQ